MIERHACDITSEDTGLFLYGGPFSGEELLHVHQSKETILYTKTGEHIVNSRLILFLNLC